MGKSVDDIFKCFSEKIKNLGVAISEEDKIIIEKSNEVIGFATIPNHAFKICYGMLARYTEDSSEADPIVNVFIEYDSVTIDRDININFVDTKDASKLEMFALCSHLDHMGLGIKNSKLGSFRALKHIEEISVTNKYFDLGDLELSIYDISDKKLNWRIASEKVAYYLRDRHDYNKYINTLEIVKLCEKYGRSKNV